MKKVFWFLVLAALFLLPKDSFAACTKNYIPSQTGNYYYVCATHSDAPSSGLTVGTLLYDVDTKNFYSADTSTSWHQLNIGGIGTVTAVGDITSGDAATAALPITYAYFKNATSGTVKLQTVAGALGSGVISLPTGTDTLIGKATTDTLTNKTYDTAGSGNSFSINGVAATANTGTGSVVRATSPTLVTPALGAATATTVNGLTVTSTTSGVLTIANSKTLTANNSITIAGTDGITLTTPSTSFTAARTDAANTFTGHQTIEGVTSTGATGTGKFVFDNSPTLVTPALGTPSALVGTNITGTATSFTASNVTTNANLTGDVTSSGNASTIAPLILPTSDVTAKGGPRTSAFNAGATITAMDLVILDSSALWQKTDANTASIYAGMIGMSLESKTSGQAMSVALPGTIIRNDAWSWTPGATIYMSETAGAITATQPTTTDAAIRVIGYAVNADDIYFNPSPDYITHT